MKIGQRISLQSSLNIVQVLGEGAFGKVYLVRKDFLNGLLPRFFALKCFHSSVSSELLRAEAEATFRVRSSHCVTVHSVENFGTGQGLLMEYVDGVTLEELARTYELTYEERASVLSQVSKGLQDLASFDQIHGDLCPRNIMIDRHGRAVLLDFGLTAIFNKGEVVGHPAYLSDSRLKGEVPSLKDDLFALELIRHDLEQKLIGKKAPPWFWEQRKVLVVGKTKIQDKFVSPPKSLSTKVEAILHTQKHSDRTMVRAETSRDWRAVRFINFVLLLITLSLQASGRPSQSASLELRSLKWIQATLPDGRSLDANQGPIEVKAGRFVLKWQTAKKTGSKSLDLAAGEKLMLSDLDFN